MSVGYQWIAKIRKVLLPGILYNTMDMDMNIDDTNLQGISFHLYIEYMDGWMYRNPYLFKTPRFPFMFRIYILQSRV